MRCIVSIYIASLVYALVRYVAFAPKNAEHIPVFIANKGVSMGAALCFAIGLVGLYRFVRGGDGAGAMTGASSGWPDSSTWFRAGVFGAIWHMPMSLAILRPAYFKEFFLPISGDAKPEVLALGPRMSMEGELVFFFGGLTAGLIFLLLRPTWTPLARWWLTIGAMLMLLGHVLAMGYCRGLNINASHAYMPPMWLLSAVGLGVGLVVLLMAKPSRRG